MGFHQNSSSIYQTQWMVRLGSTSADTIIWLVVGTVLLQRIKPFIDPITVVWRRAAQTDFNHKFHTAASCVVDDKAYIVGGDFFNPSIDGDYRRSSHKFESGSWSQIASNAGIGNRCLGGMVYLNGSFGFYIVGGQDDISGTNVSDTVMRSDDGCQSFHDHFSGH